MSANDIERLSRLIGMLPPAPAAWVRAAQELPAARREIDGIVARAEADAEFRKALIADLEGALQAEGVEPTWPLLDELSPGVVVPAPAAADEPSVSELGRQRCWAARRRCAMVSSSFHAIEALDSTRGRNSHDVSP